MGEAGYGMSAKDRETRALMRLPGKSWEHMSRMERLMSAGKLALGTLNPYMGVLGGIAGVGSTFAGPIAKEIGETFTQSLADNKEFGWNPFDKEGFERRMADPGARARYDRMKATAAMHYGMAGVADRQGATPKPRLQTQSVRALGGGVTSPNLGLDSSAPTFASSMGPFTGPGATPLVQGQLEARLRKSRENLIALSGLGRVQGGAV